MAQGQAIVKLAIPFEFLLNAIAELSLKEKFRLWQWLDEQIAQADEEALEQDPVVQAEIREARIAYQLGDYMTIEQYTASRSGKTR